MRSSGWALGAVPWGHRRAIGGRPARGAGWTPEDVFYAAGVPVLVASIAIVSLLAAEKSLIIDESDGDLDAFIPVSYTHLTLPTSDLV